MGVETESDFGDNVDWVGHGSGSLISMLEKPNLFLLIVGAIDVKIDGFVLEEKSSSHIFIPPFSSKLNWDS